jgi:hypothetical protein
MDGTTPIVILSAISALLLWRWIRSRNYPLGVSWRIESPDGRYSAAAGTSFKRFLLKRDRSWPMFFVYQEPSSMRIYEREFPELESVTEGIEGHDQILWSDDGRTVSYVFAGRAVATVDLPSLGQEAPRQEA